MVTFPKSLRAATAAALGIAILSAAAACHSSSPLDRSYAPARAALPDQPLPNFAPPTPVNVVNPEPTATAPAPQQPRIAGTWTFTVPTSVTRIMKKTGEFTQYSLYAGRPAANDTPIVVITVGPPDNASAASIAESDPATYKITAQRGYVLNGNIAHEWTGTTSTGSAFSELILTRPGATEESDVCHAMATARNAAERTQALDILKSITWTPAAP
ncbi:MAG TPA: hypothetical protein VH253_06460 [Phycisphaerae bacterium]|nr:hypothetical protein [Phycisphaerae bacterium]